MIKMREYRKRAGLTMKRLGELVGASESSISQYETGRVEPDIELIARIADVLGVSVDHLIGRTDPEPQNKPQLSDLDIRFALSSGDEPITVKQYDEVKQFVRFIRERDNGANV